jgi:hypothetical protein
MENEPAKRERVGKIARLPAQIREEVNQRLHNNEPAAKIIAWLHEQPDVLRVLDELFHEEPVSANNVSEWKRGGYQDWLERRERVGHLKTLSEHAFNLAKAGGGSITEGSVAIAGGKILELLENAKDAELADLIESLASLRHVEVAAEKEKGKKIDRAQKDRLINLAEKKFQRTTAELFLKWHDDKRIRDIADSKGTKDVKMDKLIQLVFGAPGQ